METKSLAGLGEYLRSEREKRNITIEQVASATKINVKLLHALEGDNYDALPAKPFVRGFVASYVRYVGLDHREVLARFEPYLEEKSGSKYKRPEDAPHIFVEKDGQADNSKTALTIVMVGFLVVAVIVFAIVKPSLKHHRGRGKDKAPVTNEEMITVVPPPSDSSPLTAATPQKPAEPAPVASPTASAAAQGPTAPAPVVTAAPKPTPTPKATPTPKPKPTPTPTPTPKATPTPKPKPTPTPTPTPKASAAAETSASAPANVKVPPIPDRDVKQRLTVRANEDAWVKYQVDDRPLQAYMLRKGKTIYVRATTSIRFTTGNPKALEIAYDTKTFKPLGSNAKLVVVPQSAEGQYKDQPFVAPNPAYLSTPNH